MTIGFRRSIRRISRLCALAAALSATAAQAAVVYEFQSGTDSFVYEAPDLLTGTTTVAAANLANCVNLDYGCGFVTFEFDSTVDGFDLTDSGDLVLFGSNDTGFYTTYFANNAFTTFGTYTASDGSTLTIRSAASAVPEPAGMVLVGMAMAMAGFASLGRRQR